MGRIYKSESLIQRDKSSRRSLQTQSNPTLTKPLRKKGFPLFKDVGELVDGTRATGKGTFRALVRADPATQASSTQNAAASASTSHQPVIDPKLLDMSLEGVGIIDGELDRDDPQVTEVSYILPHASPPLTTI